MKALPALLLYLLLALAPFGAQAHAGMTHCQDGPATLVSTSQVPAATPLLAAPVAADALALAAPADAQPCPHQHSGRCRCLHACSGSPAAATMLPSATLHTQWRSEAPARLLIPGMRAALLRELLRPPTTTL